MRLTFRLVSLLIGGVVLLLTIEGFVSVQWDVTLFEADMDRDVVQLGQTLKDLMEDVWHTSGRERALKLIDDANEEGRPVTVRWVWLDRPAGSPEGPRVRNATSREIAARESLTLRERTADGQRFSVTYIPVALDGPRAGAIELARPMKALEVFRRSTIVRRIVLTTVLIIGAALAALALGVHMVGRPLNQLIEKTRRVGRGDLSGPVEVSGRGELNELARALNEMCEHLAEARSDAQRQMEERIAAIEQLRHADRLRTVGRLASGVAHELGTPLNVVSGRATLIGSGDLTDADVVENADIIRAQADRMATIIRQLLTFARRRSLERQPVDLRQLALQTIDLVATLARRSGVDLILADEPPISASVDASQMQQVLSNLIVNAVQAMPDGGQIVITTGCRELSPPEGIDLPRSEYLFLSVRDTGPGISDEHLSQVFEPFFTTKDVGEGTGLGLSIACGIVQEHGGWIDVESSVGDGSVFTVYVPGEETSCRAES